MMSDLLEISYPSWHTVRLLVPVGPSRGCAGRRTTAARSVPIETPLPTRSAAILTESVGGWTTEKWRLRKRQEREAANAKVHSFLANIVSTEVPELDKKIEKSVSREKGKPEQNQIQVNFPYIEEKKTDNSTSKLLIWSQWSEKWMCLFLFASLSAIATIQGLLYKTTLAQSSWIVHCNWTVSYSKGF